MTQVTTSAVLSHTSERIHMGMRRCRSAPTPAKCPIQALRLHHFQDRFERFAVLPRNRSTKKKKTSLTLGLLNTVWWHDLCQIFRKYLAQGRKNYTTAIRNATGWVWHLKAKWKAKQKQEEHQAVQRLRRKIPSMDPPATKKSMVQRSRWPWYFPFKRKKSCRKDFKIYLFWRSLPTSMVKGLPLATIIPELKQLWTL